MSLLSASGIANISDNKFIVDVPLRTNFSDNKKFPTTLYGSSYIDPNGGPDGKGCAIFPTASYLEILTQNINLVNIDFEINVDLKIQYSIGGFDGLLSVFGIPNKDHSAFTITTNVDVLWASSTYFGWDVANSGNGVFLPSNILRDNNWHNLKIKRINDSLFVYIDDILNKTIPIQNPSSYLNLNNNNYIFLGKKSDLLLGSSEIHMCNFYIKII